MEIETIIVGIESVKWQLILLFFMVTVIVPIQFIRLRRGKRRLEKIGILIRKVKSLNRTYERLEREIRELKKRKFYVES